MLPYQMKYIENVREIAELSDFYGISAPDFESWFLKQREAKARIDALYAENNVLLRDCLFPALDELHSASEATIGELVEFAEVLLDWRTNLDSGVYLLIYDSLLSLYRFRGDRAGIIRTLYKVGMGHFYQNRTVDGIDRQYTASFFFENELVFTEAGSYLKFFSDLEDEETRGYVIRSLANIAICATDLHRRVSISSRVLRIVRDPYYRAIAPGLPWDRFLRATNQQMSANRAVLSRADLSKEDLEAIFESCYEVFRPESDNENPNIRWLWPYYEMEYSCGFVDLATTLDRLEALIERVKYDEYDESGRYGNIQLPIYYGRLLRNNPAAVKARHVRFLASAYEKMMRSVLSYPADQFGDHFFYVLRLIISDYYEIEGVPSYREITEKLMSRLAGQLYIRSRRVGDMLEAFCAAIMESDPAFFDDIDFIREHTDPGLKRAAVLEYARQCGLYLDFGLIKMNIDRLQHTRRLFDEEDRMMRLHTISGSEDLTARASTARFSDVALGHHSWYNASGGYPDRYVRNASPYRQMTDTAALVTFLSENYDGDMPKLVREAIALERRRFSPLVTAYLESPALCVQLEALLRADGEAYFREIFEEV